MKQAHLLEELEYSKCENADDFDLLQKRAEEEAACKMQARCLKRIRIID